MSTTEKKLAANRRNALRSTGPRSQNGKIAASGNATRHGLLSARLILDDECPGEFETLLTDLQQSLKPVGAIELAIVDRISLGLWRQRRLVGAETAAVAIERRVPEIADAVRREHDPHLHSDVGEEDLVPFDTNEAEWCKDVIDEIERMEEISLNTLATSAPLVHAQLTSDADEDNETVEQYLEAYDGGLTKYVVELLLWCRKDLEKADNRPRLLALADQLREKRLVLPCDQLEVLARYQTALDNQLYKALRALREAQEWRLKTLDQIYSQRIQHTTKLRELGSFRKLPVT